jgi:hypothetical protein
LKNQQRSYQALQKTKLFGRQFLSMDIMFDALFLLSKADSAQRLRVPLSALIDYKGFRCLAIGIVPILAATGPSLGFEKGTYGPTETGLKDAFSSVGQVLKLTPNEVASGHDSTT